MSFNIKNKLKRISAFALASTMAISTPFQAFADGLSGNAGGSNNQGIVTSTGGDFGVNTDTGPENSMGRIGIMLSIVDNNNT